MAERARAYRLANPEAVARARTASLLKNKAKIAERNRDWLARNKERRKEYRRRKYAENKQRENALAKAYKAENKETVAAKNAERLRRNPEINRFARSLRRAAEMRAMPRWANKAKMRAIYAEAVRLTRETGIEHHVDHIVPLQSPIVCGLHWEGNLQILAATENQSKSNRSWPHMPEGVLAMRNEFAASIEVQ